MYILGISCYYHDSAAVLLKDGVVVAAAEEERFSRKKHDSDFPHLAIKFCLDQAGIRASRLNYAVFYEKPFRKLQRIIYSTLGTYPASYATFREAWRVWLTQKLWIKADIADNVGISQDKILFTQHHLSHAASTFYPSPFPEAAILTVDGVGEWATTTFGVGQSNQVKLLKEIYFPHSLGLLYSAFTAFLGFEVNEGEWKVMGLAPYGKPKYKDQVWKVVKSYTDGSFRLHLPYFSFHYSDYRTYTHKFCELFGEPIPPKDAHLITSRAADIASSIQVVTEELLLNLAKALRKLTHSDNLCLAGGVALNSVANYRIFCESGFKNIFVQCAAGDSGGALGAALYTYHQIFGAKKRVTQTHAYFGKAYSNQEIKKFLRQQKVKYRQMMGAALVTFMAEQIAQGKVVGWMQDRFEWGPRALGNRSILADPRNPKMKDIINAKVKFREAFRPFAPSVLAEKAGDVFDLDSDYQKQQPLDYMLYVVPVKKSWKKKIPAITHADGTARPQLVKKKVNPLYHQLISKFFAKTGIPLLLNTSFNLKGEPIVTSPVDAYSTFMRSGIDILVMGPFVCEK